MNAASINRPPGRFIAAIVLGATLIPLNSTMIAVALPAIGEAFGASPGDLTLWLVTSYLLVNIVLLSPAGKLGDTLGRRRAFEIGLALFFTGIVIAALVPFLFAVAFSRILMAAGGAMLMSNAMALLRVAVPEERRPRVFGYFGAILSASAAIGPLIGGVLTQYLGWEAIFLVNLPILLLSLILVKSDSSYGRESAPKKVGRPGFDFIGMGLLTISLGGFVIGLKGGGLWTVAAVLCCVFGLYGFARWERFAADPLIDLQLFRRTPFVVGGALIGLQNLGMYALLFQLPFLLERWYRLEPGKNGQVLLAMTLCMVIFSFVGGPLAERFGAKSAILGGLFVGLAGMVMLFYTSGTATLLWMSLSLAGVGAGIGIVTGPSQAVALSVVQPEQSGAASGVLSTMRYLGGVVGITVISMILTDTDAIGFLAQNKLCFGIFAGAYLLALLLALKLPAKVELATQEKP